MTTPFRFYCRCCVSFGNFLVFLLYSNAMLLLYFYFPFLFSLPFSHRNVTELLPHFFCFTFLFVPLFSLYIICRKYQSEAVIKTIKYRKIFFNEGICIRTKKKRTFSIVFFQVDFTTSAFYFIIEFYYNFLYFFAEL